MSSSLAELQSLIAQSYDEIHHPRRDHRGLQVALVSPQRSLKSSSCLVVEFHHNGTKYQILFSNGTTALVQITNARNATAEVSQESQKLLSISHSQDAVEIYSDLSSQLEVIESLEATHDLRRLLYFIFIVYFQKNRLPCPQGEVENQIVPMRSQQGRTRPKALSVEKRLCLPYEVKRKLTFEKKLALCDKPEWAEGIHRPILGAELERRLVVPFLESSRKEILITRREIAKDFLQNLILQKLQKRISSIKNERKLAESAQGPIPLPSQESFEAPKPVLKMKPRERIMPVAEKLKNHLAKLEKTQTKAPLKKTRIPKKPSYSLVPSLSDLSFERNFNRIVSECIGKINSSICARSLNLLKIWAEPNYKTQEARVCIPCVETPKASLLKQITPQRSSQALVVSNNKRLKFAPGLPISSILKAHYFNYQKIMRKHTLSGPIKVEIKSKRQLALPYKKTLALPYKKTLALPYKKTLALSYEKVLALPYQKVLALPYMKIYALPSTQKLAITYLEPEAIPLPNKETVIALPNKPVLAITYQPILALPYTKVLALPYETPSMEIPDIHKFLEPKWLDYLGMNSVPVSTLKFYTDSSCQEHTTSVELSFSSSDESENLLDDDEISLQESFIEEANQENLPLLEAQSTSELSEIDLDLQVSTQFLESQKPDSEDVYGFEVIPDDEIVIIEEDVVCVNDAGY